MTTAVEATSTSLLKYFRQLTLQKMEKDQSLKSTH